MAGASTQQYGIKNWRINREPIDGEFVHLTYQEIKDRLITNEDGNGTTLGAFYGGLITSVTSDPNNAYNGPWYISYNITNNRVSYSAERIPLANDIAKIEKKFQTSYNNLHSYVQENFVTHNQLKSTGECIDASYVTTLGKEANLNIILPSLLTPANYTKPSFEFKLSDGKNGPIYGKNNATITDPGNVIEVGSIINLCVNLKVSNYNNNHNTLGLSYGLKNYSFQYQGVNYSYNLPESYLVASQVSQNATYTFSDEGLNLMIDNIYLSYQKSSYAYYPQLKSKGVYVPSKENWFGETRFKIEDYNIISKYKYYYGWDAHISDSSFNPTQGTYKWLPIKKTGEIITTENILFTDNHSSFWFAIPKDVVEKTTTSKNKYKVLYHTAIGDADLVSTSTTEKVVTKNITVGNNNNTHPYIITEINFNGKTIEGHPNDYVKFSMKKVK